MPACIFGSAGIQEDRTWLGTARYTVGHWYTHWGQVVTSASLLDAERDLQRGIRDAAIEAGYAEDESRGFRS